MKFKYNMGEATGSAILYMGSFLLIVAIILVGLYGGFISFFKDGYDYRYSESRALLKSVQECFENNVVDVKGLNAETFFVNCKLSKEVIEDGAHFIYFKDKIGNEFSLGVSDFKVQCGLDARFDKFELPICSYSYSDYGYFIAGSSQSSRRVSV